MCGFQGTDKTIPEEIPVTMAKGSHLFPYRTQKLSLSAPMVLGWRRPGRVGRCRIPKREAQQMLGFFFTFLEDNARIRKYALNNCGNGQNLEFDAECLRGVE